MVSEGAEQMCSRWYWNMESEGAKVMVEDRLLRFQQEQREMHEE